MAPAGYTEHSNWPVDYGAWYISQILDILVSNPEVFSKTVLIINYLHLGRMGKQMIVENSKGRAEEAYANQRPLDLAHSDHSHFDRANFSATSSSYTFCRTGTKYRSAHLFTPFVTSTDFRRRWTARSSRSCEEGARCECCKDFSPQCDEEHTQTDEDHTGRLCGITSRGAGNEGNGRTLHKSESPIEPILKQPHRTGPPASQTTGPAKKAFTPVTVANSALTDRCV